MSGPIVRKYGFPNFDKIFGERKLEHGVETPVKPDETPKAPEPNKAEDRPENPPARG